MSLELLLLSEILGTILTRELLVVAMTSLVFLESLFRSELLATLLALNLLTVVVHLTGDCRVISSLGSIWHTSDAPTFGHVALNLAGGWPGCLT